MGDLWWRDPERCHRCRTIFAADATLFIVRNRVIYDEIPGLGAGIHMVEWLAVCGACLSGRAEMVTRSIRICAGCGRSMSVPLGYHGQVCSSRCAQRTRRAKRRADNMAVCEVCRVAFSTRRRDARFCSGACRQWAYRLRNHSLVTGQRLESASVIDENGGGPGVRLKKREKR